MRLETFGVTVTSIIFYMKMESLLKTYQSQRMSGKDNCKIRLEAATVSGILYYFVRENFSYQGKGREFRKVMSVATMVIGTLK